MQSMSAAARFEVYGRVQGVGFRAFVLHAAKPLRLEGWVRNRADGAVEVAAQGSPANLERLQHCLTQGPPGASVTRVERQAWIEPKWRTADFVILD
jgi:acylphosphatase